MNNSIERQASKIKTLTGQFEFFVPCQDNLKIICFISHDNILTTVYPFQILNHSAWLPMLRGLPALSNLLHGNRRDPGAQIWALSGGLRGRLSHRTVSCGPQNANPYLPLLTYGLYMPFRSRSTGYLSQYFMFKLLSENLDNWNKLEWRNG